MTARCSRASASARKVFWMMLSGAGGGFGALGRIASAGAIAASRFSGGFAGFRRRFSGRHVHGDAVERKVPPLRFRIRRRLTFGRGRRRLLGGGVAGLLNLELIVEHGLAERRRRLQSRHFEQHAIGTGEFGLDEAARIGGRIEKIAGRPAARAQSEAIERNKGCLRIAGHRISLEILSRAYSAAEYNVLRCEPGINSASGCCLVDDKSFGKSALAPPRLRQMRH